MYARIARFEGGDREGGTGLGVVFFETEEGSGRRSAVDIYEVAFRGTPAASAS